MYYIVFGFLYLLSLLPLSILYILSNGIYFLIYYVIGYRKEVVMGNLAIAFPGKTAEDRKKIAKEFYRNLVDNFIETIKLISASRQEINKRFTGNWEVVNQLKASGKNCQLHLGHNFNWELANAAAALNFNYTFSVVYMPVTNKVFDRLMLYIRARTGSLLLPATNMKKYFRTLKENQHILTLVADQNPGNPSNSWWISFMNKPAPFVKGPAKGAISNNTNVIFADIQKIKRGYYKVVFSVACTDTSHTTEQELTKKFVRFLEQTITKNPSLWLWSHRRWKWDWKQEFGDLWIE